MTCCLKVQQRHSDALGLHACRQPGLLTVLLSSRGLCMAVQCLTSGDQDRGWLSGSDWPVWDAAVELQEGRFSHKARMHAGGQYDQLRATDPGEP
jgi:hypothetical protein